MIPLFKVVMSDVAALNVTNVLKSGYVGEGNRVKELEQEIESLFGYKGIKLVNSATSAIELACQMIGIKEGDEVITTPITCTATQTGALLFGATLVWADVNPQTGLIDPNDVARKITSKTKAIIGVNWGGAMCDWDTLNSFGIPTIEDAAHGSYWSTKTRGNYVVWSFGPIKHLTCGDGGALLSPDPDRARLLRWHGLDRESTADFRCSQNITEYGRKLHMNDINASIGLANLTMLPTILQIHNDNAATYQHRITNTKITKPVYDKDHPYWLYTILVNDRDKFIEYLKEKGIASSQVHARNDKHSGFSRVKYAYQNPGVDFFDTHQVSIPVGSWLSDYEMNYIIDIINQW